MNGYAGLGVDQSFRPSARRSSRIEGRRILFVDDELLMRRAVARLLRGAGASCLGAATHDETVVLLAFEPRLDLAILDYQVPDGGVGRLVRRLRWQRPALPLVGTSASDHRSEFAALGVGRFLQKPWGLDELIDVADWAVVPDSSIRL